MLVAFWIVASLLALAFLGAGVAKLSQSKEALAKSGARMAWTEDYSAGTVKLIGALEALGAVGVIVPALTGIAPVLSPLAAAGLAIIMVAAIVVHVRRKESYGPAAGLLLLAVAAMALGFAAVV